MGNKKIKFKQKKKKNKIRIENRKRFLISIFIFTVIVVSGGAVLIKGFTSESGVSKTDVGKIVSEDSKEVNSQQEADAEKSMAEEATKKEEAKKEEEAKSKILLVNKKHPIGPEYKPEDLVTANISYASVANPMVEYVTKDAATALENMFQAAKKDGITLLGVSGYRSYEYQKQVFDDSVRAYGMEHSKKYVAIPGSSEHQTGLCIDVLSNEYSSLDEGFENTKAFKWLMEHMRDYGFILRYPKGKQDITGYNYEAWHIRYVGVDAARKIAEKDITLEEYLNKL